MHPPPVAKDRAGAWNRCRRDLSTCSRRQTHALDRFRHHMVEKVEGLLARGVHQVHQVHRAIGAPKEHQSGAFLLSCHIHCQSLWSNTWHSPKSPRVNGKSIAEAVGEWFRRHSCGPQVAGLQRVLVQPHVLQLATTVSVYTVDQTEVAGAPLKREN